MIGRSIWGPATICLAATVAGFWPAQSKSAETLACDFGEGSGPRWAAAWCDLDQSEDFGKDDRLCLRIGGAREVLVRFLPAGTKPDQPVGIENGIRTVPESGVLEITLASGHPRVSQVSIHGGPSAWKWGFSDGNKAPTLLGIERLSPGDACK